MKRTLGLLLATLLMAACSSVGNVFKKTGQVLMNPSIQVGTAENQPTQVALSMHAASDVNPNPLSLPVPEAATDSQTLSGEDEDGPYAIRLNSPSRGSMIESLRALLGHLEDEAGTLPPVMPVFLHDATSSPFSLDRSFAWERLAVSSTSPSQPHIHWQLSEDESRETAEKTQPLPLATVDVRDRDSLAPGQYKGGITLSGEQASPVVATSAATPIAFRIVQLKDDSLLLNATHEQIQQNLKKALGSTFLSADDYLLVPGQFKFINFRPLHEDANFIAVVADFSDPSAAMWKDLIHLEPRGRKYALLVTLQGTRVSIIDESYHASTPSPARIQP